MSEPHLLSVDGELFKPGEACLPLPDDGLLRGDGAFEVIRLYAGRPFAFQLHLDRMERSAAAIDLPLPRDQLSADARRLIEAHGRSDGLLRLVQTRAGRRIVSVEPLPDHPPAITLASVVHTPATILTGVKSLSYAANMEATRIARKAGAAEALFVRPDGIVLEAPTSTVFWASAEGRLRTAALEAGVLDSITRRKVLEQIEVEEGEFPLEDLLSAPEAFLASTTREIQPVSRVDDHEYRNPPGPMTGKAEEAFRKALTADLDS